jgi:hypothetical protein
MLYRLAAVCFTGTDPAVEKKKQKQSKEKMIRSQLSYLLLWCTFFVLLERPIVCSDIEDKLETQIDPREPRNFRRNIPKLLSVRVQGFKNMTRHLPDHDEIVNVPNWETFATK